MVCSSSPSSLVRLGVLIAIIASPCLARQHEPAAQIRGPLFSATVHETGVLVTGPDAGLIPTWGPLESIGPTIVEWHGLQFVDGHGQTIAGAVGAAPDWGERTPVTLLSFEATEHTTRSRGQLGPLEIITEHFFEEDGRHLIGQTTLINQSDQTLKNVLFSYEWTCPGLGELFPSDLEGALPPAPLNVRRSVWMPDDMPPGHRTAITLSYWYDAAQPDAGRRIDVPLQLLTTPNWPSGIVVDRTNGVSWSDEDADGWPDFFSANGVELWRNLKGQDFRRFRKLRQQLDPNVIRYGSSFGDYNNDGYPDLGTEPRGNDNMDLFKNLGGQSDYIRVSNDPNIIDNVPFGASETICWGDVDHDGDLDYFLPVYPPWAFGGPGNFFLHNLGPTGPAGAYRFTEVTQAVGLWNPPNSARPEGAEYCDVDFDGDLDLYSNGTLYQNHSTFDAPSFLWMTEAASGIQFSTDYDEGCAFFDVDMDGDEDLGIAYCVGSHGVRIFENLGDGMFDLMPKSTVDSPNTGLCLGFSKADWDNDGDMDFTTKEVFRLNQYAQTGQVKFTVATHNIPGGHLTNATPAWADWDKDGDLDGLLGNWLNDGHMYENTTYDATTPDEERRSIRVRVLRDAPGIKRGLETEYGARVQVFVHDEENQTRRIQLVSSAGGYLNQNEYAVHFAMPPDPTPGDPTSDVKFDLVVTFPSDPSVGIHRVDRFVNAELGNLDWGDLSQRELWVFRSGRVKKNGCFYEPTLNADPVLTTTTAGLALPTDTTPLPPRTPTPNTDWSVGIDFDTNLAAGPVRLKEILLDGKLDAAAACGADSYRVMLWDVTNAGSPVLVDGLDTRRWNGNVRHRYRASTVLPPGRHYRLIARVRELRASPIAGPVVSDEITVHGGLSFQDLAPCSGAATEAATVDPSNVYMAVRFVQDPGETWADLGFAVAGTNGTPSLTGSGAMTTGTTVSLDFQNGPSNQLTFLVMGTTVACTRFAGGTLLPSPEFFLFPTTSNSGSWQLSAPWPAGSPSGDTLYFHVWFPDAGAVGGWAASNAVSGTTPF